MTSRHYLASLPFAGWPLAGWNLTARRRICAIGFLPAAMFFVTATFNSVGASADALWGLDGQPVFRSDRRERPSRRQDNTRFNQPYSYQQPQYPPIASGGPRPVISPIAPPIVQLESREAPGTVIIDSERRRLFYVTAPHAAYQYPISVGREGFAWTGTEKISAVKSWPDWHPPAEMRARQPGLPEKMTGGLRNPLGAKALYLGRTLYRIHGTNDPKTIGRAASSGCFRMMNAHVMHLSRMVEIGTTVRVVKRYRAAPATVAQRR